MSGSDALSMPFSGAKVVALVVISVLFSVALTLAVLWFVLMPTLPEQALPPGSPSTSSYPLTEDASAPSAVEPSSWSNPVTKALAQTGVHRCLSQVDRVTRFLANGQKPNVYLYAPNPPADQSTIFLSQELRSQNNSSVYASATFNPNGTGNCEGSYETVSYHPSSCNDLANSQLRALTSRRTVGNIQMFDVSATTSTFLMAAGTGCLTVKKERF